MIKPEQDLLNYKYNQEQFCCSRCMTYKPISAMKEVNTKKLWCITCFDRMIDNKVNSYEVKKRASHARYKAKLGEFRNGNSTKRPVLY